MQRRAFTLIELLVVIAIIAILAAILFPVFAQAKESAKGTSDLSNTKQNALSIIGYQADHDDYLPPVNGCDWGSGVYGTVNCPTYPQLVQPYAKNWQIHRSPGDPNNNEATYGLLPDDSGPCPAGVDKGACYGWRSNYGYNFMYLSLPVYGQGGSPNGRPNPQTSSRLGDPAKTVLFVNSIWWRVGGRPSGGGNWAVNAPCYINPDGMSYAVPTTYSFYYLATQTGQMWDYNDPMSATQFGYAYPFWRGGRVMNVGWSDGHAKVARVGELVKGCNPDTGVILDKGDFVWDLD